jgi:hypothetical protein
MYSIKLSHCIDVFPHAEFDGLMTRDEMLTLANEIKDVYEKKQQLENQANESQTHTTELPKDDSIEAKNAITKIPIIYKSSFCSELNGPWNVVMSWEGYRNERDLVYSQESGKLVLPQKKWTYTYIIMRDIDTGRTYCGPLQNAEYIYDTYSPIARFSETTYKEQWSVLDNFMKTRQDAKMINRFPCASLTYIANLETQYDEKHQQISENEKLIAELITKREELISKRNEFKIQMDKSKTISLYAAEKRKEFDLKTINEE